MSNLSPSQQARLEAAYAQRRKMRSEAQPKNEIFIDRSRYADMLKAEIAEDEIQVKEKMDEVLEMRVSQWEERIDSRWRNAHTDNQVILDRVERFASGNGLHKISILNVGSLGVGKTYSAYCYASELVRKGVLESSQIAVISDETISSVSQGGFHASEKLASILKPEYKFFLIDDVGQGTYRDPSSRQTVWHQILDHIYSKKLALAMTTNLSIKVPSSGEQTSNGKPTKAVIDAKGRAVNKSEMNLWVGDAAFSRLVTILGEDGIIVPGNTNMREKIFKEWEDTYRKNKALHEEVRDDMPF